VRTSAREVVALDVADEVERRHPAEPAVRRDERLAALRRFHAHVEQRDARARHLGDAPGVRAAHEGELHELLRLATDGRADVEYEGARILTRVFGVPRVDARQRGATDALQ